MHKGCTFESLIVVAVAESGTIRMCALAEIRGSYPCWAQSGYLGAVVPDSCIILYCSILLHCIVQ
jgi:hypothetical protein